MTIIPNSTTDHGSNRSLAAMVYEKNRTQILMTGGKDINKNSLIATSIAGGPIDTWAFPNGGAWSILSPATNPFHRHAHAMAFSNDDGYTFLFGGKDNIAVIFYNDLWYYNGTTWGQFATVFTPGSNAPNSRFSHSMVSADGYSSVFLFGGIGTTLLQHQDWLQDTWLFSTTSKTWTQITSAIVPPERANFGGLAFDGYNIYMWGGEGPAGNQYLLQDMWKMNALGQQWNAVSQGSTLPTARKGHSLVWDGFNSQLMLFGGYTVNNGLSNETWIFKNGAWSLLTTTTHPTRRQNASMVFDSGNNTIVLFGGTDLTNSPLGDVWTFNCSTQTWSGQGDFSSAQAGGPVSDH